MEREGKNAKHFNCLNDKWMIREFYTKLFAHLWILVEILDRAIVCPTETVNQ